MEGFAEHGIVVRPGNSTKLAEGGAHIPLGDDDDDAGRGSSFEDEEDEGDDDTYVVRGAGAGLSYGDIDAGEGGQSDGERLAALEARERELEQLLREAEDQTAAMEGLRTAQGGWR